METIYNNKNMHSSLDVAKEKVGYLHLNMCSTFQSKGYNSIPKCVTGCYTLTTTWAPKQMGT
jgi:hypothetical protein